ncbi:SAM-dependent methyltransferase [Nonomuraea sp. PA05]|uniref:SAM-dependent methyltransferase n=1 Tax=Nonomuraea sp. PA05 TaxID=2604466 RepID=UPI0011D53EE9|nr:SAM-dependent methyltransferase [Nonomuraea sp. PA05]TYB71167.1 SAM-dependent methyltransferase [Nonomuraea sp. PA05]
MSSIDQTKPSPARMYDFLLGGKENFEIDRQQVQIVLQDAPEARDAAVINRRFLAAATGYAASCGVKQFLDVGSGLPTQDNVHQVAQRMVPDASVVYVDNDPTVLLHAQGLLNDPRTGYINGDVMTPAEIISNPVTQELIDLTKPVALLLVAVLHFVPDGNDPYGIVHDLMEQLAPGSMLILSHVTTDEMSPVVSERISRQQLAVPLNLRSGKEILRFFDGLDLVDPPGFVFTEQWAPGKVLSADASQPLKLRCGVAVKP